MSPAQDQLYWRLWGQAARARGWQMAGGMLKAQRPEAASHDERMVWDVASGLADQARRPVVADDLRHACNAVASDGRQLSHKRLSNPEIDRLFALLRLLADDTDLEAAMAFQDPERGERERMVHKLKAAVPFAYLDAICRDRFAGVYRNPYWEDLPMADLRKLFLTVSERTHRFTRPVPSARRSEPAQGDNCPF